MEIGAAANSSFLRHLVVVVHGNSSFRFPPSDGVAAAGDMRRLETSEGEGVAEGLTPERCEVPLQGSMYMEADELRVSVFRKVGMEANLKRP